MGSNGTRGVTRATFDAAFAGVTPDPRVIAQTQRQPEYGKPIGAYLAAIASGKSKALEWSGTLDAIEKNFGVDRAIVLAVWGASAGWPSDRGHAGPPRHRRSLMA
jgi:membrane-bound lytic murein transglycosylase B